ncbi:MAG: hypothetical protein Q4Q03_03505 [Bowdeniella nasicola]|nr:hypothetical protein [Bowdeniella nasicola]
MSKAKKFMKFVQVAGPAFAVLRSQLPKVVAFLDENPQVKAQVSDAITKATKWTRSSFSPQALLERVGVLREQVDYLHRSADDAGEVAEAERFARQLDRIAHSIMLIEAATGRQRRRQITMIRAHLESLSEEILARFISETIEDEQRHRPPRPHHQLGWKQR